MSVEDAVCIVLTLGHIDQSHMSKEVVAVVADAIRIVHDHAQKVIDLELKKS